MRLSALRVPARRRAPAAPQPVNVRVEQTPRDEDAYRGPSTLAGVVWVFVRLLALIVCGGLGLAGYVALTLPLEDFPAFARPFRLTALFGFAALLLVPAYIADRAIDRLTQ